LNQDFYLKLISGQKHGFWAFMLRLLLSVVSVFYWIAVGIRNLLFDQKIIKQHKEDVPVLSVGNITAGGTGKTPLVIWLCNLLKEKNIRCAVLTRGYKAENFESLDGQQAFMDEPAVFEQNCPDVPVIIQADRIAGAILAVDTYSAKALIMDDGFQHRKLYRDLDIITIDAMDPFGSGKLLPAGLLREPAGSLRRADIVVMTRCDKVSKENLEAIAAEIWQINPDLPIVKSIHQPVSIIYSNTKIAPPDELNGKNVFAFCGIGNPNAFFETLKVLGANLTGCRSFNDHYHYVAEDINKIAQTASKSDAKMILTTEKDWTKIQSLLAAQNLSEIPFAFLKIDMKIIDGEEKFRRLIENALASKIIRSIK